MTANRAMAMGDLVLVLIVMALMAVATYVAFKPGEQMSDEQIKARITVDCVKTGLQYRGLNVFLQSTGIEERDVRRAEDFRHHIEKLINYHQSVVLGIPLPLADACK